MVRYVERYLSSFSVEAPPCSQLEDRVGTVRGHSFRGPGGASDGRGDPVPDSESAATADEHVRYKCLVSCR